MNFQNLSFDFVEPLQPPPAAHVRASAATAQPQTLTRRSEDSSEATVRPHEVDDDSDGYDDELPEFCRHTGRRLHHRSSDNTNSSLFADASSSRREALPSVPSPPSADSSPYELYGPDRLLGPPLNLPESDRSYLRDAPRYTIDEIHSIALHTAIAGQLVTGMGYKDQLALEAGKVTPGVDDAPYIQYALEVLTRDRDSDAHASSSSGGSNPFHHMIPDRGLGYYAPPSHPMPQLPPSPPANTKLRLDPQDRRQRFSRPADAAAHANRPSARSSNATLVSSPRKPGDPYKSIPKDAWISVQQNKFSPDSRSFYPTPNFVPKILRPTWMLTLTTLCLLMTAALIFCAAYSQSRNGLLEYSGTIYSGQYVVFRILPQLLAAVIQLYTHAVVMTTFRVLPFAQMDARSYPHPKERYGSIFQDMYPRSFLLPHLVGPVQVCVSLFVMWVMNIAVPLQSSLFDIVLVDGQWRWATVSGIAYVLAILYLILAAAVITLMLYWRNRQTGLIWDPKSIADIAALGVHSKVSEDYRGTDRLATREEMKVALNKRMADKLSYWAWRDRRDGEVWFGMQSDDHDDEWLADLPSHTKPTHLTEKPHHTPDLEAAPIAPVASYLPPRLRTLPLLVSFALASTIFLVTLLLSVLPQTSLRAGFLPLVNPIPSVPGAFSSANFLYSFLPSLLAQALYLTYLPLDLSLRILTPWAEMSTATYSTVRNSLTGQRTFGPGATAETSILAEYAASPLPWQTPILAFKNGHIRLAAVSTLSVLLIFLPILSGALFTALTSPDGTVRMYPSVPVLAVVLGLLGLYTLAIGILIPSRQQFALPHDVRCIAEVMSFVSSPEMVSDVRFRTRSGKSLLQKGMLKDRLVGEGKARWVLGVKGGRFGVRAYVPLPATGGLVGVVGGSRRLGGSRRMRREWEGGVLEAREREVVQVVEGERRASPLR